jgi:hypothetical protein
MASNQMVSILLIFMLAGPFDLDESPGACRWTGRPDTGSRPTL